ncbi:MAG TPA: hypothetical protein DCW88_08710, partial [Agrobacterium sp.]|nr:hypothetical protein [Agrobacterium sp.]
LSAQVQDLARIELAARFVEKRRDDYVREHGSYDPSTGFTEFPGSGEEYVGELEEIIDGIRKLDPATAQVQDTPEKVGRFGHHPEPAIDFCIEVEALEGHLFDAKHGIGKPGHEPRRIDDEFRRRVSSAMDFIVGGDQIAIAAKATLRSISAQVQDV